MDNGVLLDEKKFVYYVKVKVNGVLADEKKVDYYLSNGRKNIII
jgi:hypothetical protein